MRIYKLPLVKAELGPHAHVRYFPIEVLQFIFYFFHTIIIAMSWFKNKQNTSCVRNFCSKVLKAGEIPRHVAIIMDGNRRFAKKINCERSEGHEKGFEKLTEVLCFTF